MLPIDRDYHIVWDRKSTHPYLAWKKDGDFWALFMHEYKIDRVIVSSVPVVLPHPKKKKQHNGWTRCDVDKPYVKDIYECSPDVLVYDSFRGFICECFFTFTENGSEWCDSESMGPYDRHNFDPDFWIKLPTVADMEYLACH